MRLNVSNVSEVSNVIRVIRRTAEGLRVLIVMKMLFVDFPATGFNLWE